MGSDAQVLFILYTRETNMYLSTEEVIGMSIALASAIVLIILTTIANYQIQKENKFLRTRLRVQRQYCQQQHAKVPF